MDCPTWNIHTHVPLLARRRHGHAAVPRPVPPCPGPYPGPYRRAPARAPHPAPPAPGAPRSRRPSRHPGRPLLRAELRLHQLTGPGELGLGVRRVDRVVAGAEVLEEAVDDLLTGEAGLRAHRVHPLVRAAGALVGELLLADPQHLAHLV